MKDLKYKGFTYITYSRFVRNKWKHEVIKFKTGYRNLWERVRIDEYNKIRKLISLT